VFKIKKKEILNPSKIKRIFRSKHQAKYRSCDCPVIGMGGEEKLSEESVHDLVGDVRVRLKVFRYL